MSAASSSTSSYEVRHLGLTDEDRRVMLAVLGLRDEDELADAAIPAAIRSHTPLTLPAPLSEVDAQRRLAELAARNHVTVPLYGQGYFSTVTPAVIRRNLLENPAWYTAYTPYQPEISQGRLEALATFQTMVSDLTGLPTAGASLLDEATAVAEAVALARRVTKTGRVALVDPDILPASLAVLRTRAASLGIEVEVPEASLAEALPDADPFCVVVSYPGASGRLASQAEVERIAALAHARGAQVIAATDPLALTLIAAPGAWGADVAVGSTQRFGVPLWFGGPHAAFIAVRDGLERQLPGRLVGLSVDADGTPAYRLALQTREQHIRREKATSNICTSQVLLAVTAAMYAVYHGPSGLREISGRVHMLAARFAAALGDRLVHDQFVDTVQFRAPGAAADLVDKAHRAGLLIRQVDSDVVSVSFGEATTEDHLALLAGVVEVTLPAHTPSRLAGHQRSVDYLRHPVFNDYHSETSLMRYLRALSDRDYALDRGMIPLGSCTMKLNPAAGMEPISWPGFADIHPGAPQADAQGYADLVADLCVWLAEITGYDRVSLQPNAGSQGEYAGLLAIRGYHDSRGDTARRVCLIPSSAHGTNAASATLAGLRVVVVKAADDGSIDLEDLTAKVDRYASELAAVMVTYPSTHGVFEPTITQVCALVHAAGGQVYVDGANLNALVGLARPGQFGADVSHLNLHKTFAIPHGGGGPGVGPVAVKQHLAPFLPGDATRDPQRAVSQAMFGSAGVLPITYAYIAMMGAQGLRQATLDAILSANYIARRLAGVLPTLYVGEHGLVAHECILDLRPLTKRTGVTVDDVAKRLMDHGFHAPTMSFPVPGTLMVEPTESESLVELDRFCDAMIAIVGEADCVAAGMWPADDNPLVNAPHPLARIVSDTWKHAYPRGLAAFPAGRPGGPLAGGTPDKYWPATGRIDGAYGDRNLVCTCPPPEAFEDPDTPRA